MVLPAAVDGGSSLLLTLLGTLPLPWGPSKALLPLKRRRSLGGNRGSLGSWGRSSLTRLLYDIFIYMAL